MTEAATVRVQRVMPAAPDVVFDEWLDPRVVAGVDVSAPRPSPRRHRRTATSAELCASISTIRAPAF